MIVITHDTPKIFDGKSFLITKEQEQAMQTIADAIVNNKQKVIELLAKYNVTVNDANDTKALTETFVLSLYKNKEMQQEFADSLVKKRFSNATDGYTAATVGIMNAFASIFNAFKPADNTGAIAATNQQIIALVAEQERIKRRNNTIAIVFISVLALVGGYFIYINYKKNK